MLVNTEWKMTEEPLFYPKQHQPECEQNSELLLLAVANVLFIFLYPLLGKKKTCIFSALVATYLHD